MATAAPEWSAAMCVAVAVGALARVLLPVRARAAARIRPYTAVTRTALGLPPDPVDAGGTVVNGAGPAAVVLGPLRAAAQRVGSIVEARSDDTIELRLEQAGQGGVTVVEHRVGQVASGARLAVLLAAAGVVFVSSPALVVALAAVGFVAGTARERGKLDRAIARRTERIELELATVNQLLAMHVRSGSGAVQAVQRIVDRGHGALVEELDRVLVSIRSGTREVDAFRHAADITPCRDAARTYQLLATAVERGSDLGGALLAVADDLRDARREALHKTSVKRRAAMLAPTIGILAPIMLLFVAAPLPSVVFGGR